jgi:putative hemolysin
MIALTGCEPAGSQVNQAAVAYCQKNGGKVETRYPFYDTSSQKPLRLMGSLDLCTFTASDLSRISIALDTLYTDQPTMAGLAYVAKPDVGGASPSSDYCSKLGGSDRFGREGDLGGGWGYQDGSNLISLCVFPDLSVIDSWGLSDHTAGAIRGADLAPLLRYHPEQSRKPFQP